MAVDGVSLSLAPDEVLALIGPVGSGKTTLLRLIAGLETPTAGIVRFGSDDITAEPPQARKFAMLFQSQALFGHLNVEMNLALGLKIRGLPRLEIRERVAQTLDRFDLTALRGSFPDSLSGGERQRVALGRALAQRPRLWLLDEPLAGLDLPGRRDCLRRLRDLHASLKTAMIVVTHDQNEALALGDRVAVLRRGRIEQIDPPSRLYARPVNRWVAEFLSLTPTNFFNGTLIAEGGNPIFLETPRRSSPDWPPLRLSLRPRRGLERRINTTVCLALRAESVIACTESSTDAADMEMIVDWVEPATSGMLIHGRRHGEAVVAFATRQFPPPTRGSVVACRCSTESAFLFESTGSGRIIDPEEDPGAAGEIV